MGITLVEIYWPNGKKSKSMNGDDWLNAAKEAGVNIPTGCLGGSCGACEIEVNGEIIRACINKVNSEKEIKLKVEFISDPFWED